MTDDLNRLRAVALTDDEREMVDWHWQEWATVGAPRPEVWHEDSHLAFLAGVDATLSIVAARTAALLERAETERDAVAATCDLFGLPHSATALQRHITNNWAAIRNADASTIRILVARTDAVASFADQLERTTESHNQWIVNELRSLLAAAPTETEGTPDE